MGVEFSNSNQITTHTFVLRERELFIQHSNTNMGFKDSLISGIFIAN
jgi:hypothetical protein